MKIPEYFKTQITEIESDRKLMLYGMALSFTHLLTAIFWRSSVPDFLSDPYPICWPFWTDCHLTHVLSSRVILGILMIYGASAASCAALFWRGRGRAGYFLLLTLTAFKYLLLVQDYRLMGNYHYMPFLVLFAYLFIPAKSWTIRVLITLFYVSAGTLKLNYEWLSGASIGRQPPFLSAVLFHAACAYVVIMELVLVWGLWSRNAAVRWIVAIQLVLFHGISWYWVGYFYPLIMGALDCLFLITWIWPDPSDEGVLYPPPMLRGKLQLAYLGVFVFMQLPPHLSKADAALDGNLRITSLNMYDARSVCIASFLLHYTDRVVEYSPEEYREVRVRCDPVIFRSVARNLCRDQSRVSSFIDLDLYLEAKRSTGSEYKSIVHEENFCSTEVEKASASP